MFDNNLKSSRLRDLAYSALTPENNRTHYDYYEVVVILLITPHWCKKVKNYATDKLHIKNRLFTVHFH